jgi:predicted phosphodiesterase
MRYLALTDIHSNLEALTAVLDDAAGRSYDRTILLGDVVGYGPDPNAVIERVQALAPVAVIRGNHDKVSSGLEGADGFNAVARSAAQWTLATLTPAHRDWLASMATGPVLVDDLLEICHGAPFDEDAYVFDELDAIEALRSASRPVCVFGHTHYPVAFSLVGGAIEVLRPTGTAESQLSLQPDVKYLINPGAVGQPRDGDPRAAYAIVDTDHRRMEWYRVHYPVELTQAKVSQAGLPKVLGQRLTVGR